MAGGVLTVEMVRERAWLRQEIPRRQAQLGLVLDLDGGQRQLAAMREELEVLDRLGGVLGRPERSQPPVYELTPGQAARLVGMSRRQLLGRVARTPAGLWPCIDKATRGTRRHLRFDQQQLARWAEEKSWQASDPTPEDGSSDGESLTQPVPASESSAHGSAPTPKPRPRSTGRRPRLRSVTGIPGVPLTGDPDLDGLV